MPSVTKQLTISVKSRLSSLSLSKEFYTTLSPHIKMPQNNQDKYTTSKLLKPKVISNNRNYQSNSLTHLLTHLLVCHVRPWDTYKTQEKLNKSAQLFLKIVRCERFFKKIFQAFYIFKFDIFIGKPKAYYSLKFPIFCVDLIAKALAICKFEW